MKIQGIGRMTVGELKAELQKGARFVVFQYCISLLVTTYKRPSDIYFVRPGENAVIMGLVFSLISMLFGWWGFPWGPVYTIRALRTNFGGGQDVTQDVLATIVKRAGA
jgi:hypothetical protein